VIRRGRGAEYCVPRWFFITLLFLAIGLSLILWSKLRIPTLDLQREQDGSFVETLASVAHLAHGPLTEGNQIEVLQDEAFFHLLLADIAAARESIHFENFVWWTGDINNRLAAAIAAKAREGVTVRMLLDASGSSKMDDALIDMLRDAGVKFERFRTFRIWNIGRINSRTHRRVVVIDGHIGYTGGHGIGGDWAGEAETGGTWRDTSIRVRGPLVHQMQAVFAKNWIETTGEVPAHARYFPPLEDAGTITAHLAYSSPGGNASAVNLLYFLAISSAQQEIVIQNPYFIPSRHTLEALTEAVARGVRVTVMLPSAAVTDMAIVQHASHRLYEELLESGVTILEYERTLLHQKVMVIDRIWSSVGTANFDPRSIKINEELTVGILDEAIAAELLRAFEADLRFARRIELQEWRNRGILHKIQDRLAYLLNEQL
jgi:cardiolipin synthase A/B